MNKRILRSAQGQVLRSAQGQAEDGRFDLSRFVLDYLELHGSIVTPPAYGVHEVLMPDRLAAELGSDAYRRFAFTQVEGGEAAHLGIGHPLVEAIAERLQDEPGNARAYVNMVRLDKRGLAALAAKTFGFANARLNPAANAQEMAALHHYLRFNFKAALITDQKDERLISVVMDAQAGHAVQDADVLERLQTLEMSSAFADLPTAAPRWLAGARQFDLETYLALLQRARAAVERDLGDTLDGLRARTERYLELDTARIEAYYDALEGDLLQRLQRQEEDARRRDLEGKVAALRHERTVKLADVQERYRLRVELELVNVLEIVQPKLMAQVQIANRTATIIRQVVWDPLVHRLEPLVCDVCGQPGAVGVQDGAPLHLCTGGHLAHETCLAPQCIDCKREFCRLCQDQVRACVVCERPVCHYSLISCPTCGRGACREHQTLCHAAEGQPVRLAEQAKTPEPAAKPKPKPEPPKPLERGRTKGRESAKTKAKPKPAPPSRKPAAPLVKAVKLNVEIFEDRPEIIAYVMRSANRTLATRVWTLEPNGITVSCHCEKERACAADSIVHRPGTAAAVQIQIAQMLEDIRQEYMVPTRRVEYYYQQAARTRESQVFLLPAVWKDENRLAACREAFDNMVRYRRGR